MEKKQDTARNAAIKESQILLDCLQSLNPGWRQQDAGEALHISQNMISDVRHGKKPMSEPVRELARRIMQDGIAELAGEDFSYRQVQGIARYFEQLHSGPEARDPDEMFAVALKIFEDGYYIM